MDAASQLVYCGVDPFCRSSPSPRRRHSLLHLRRHSSRVFAVSAEPKPAPAKTLNGEKSRSPPSRAVNGVSTKIGDVSKEIKRVRAQMEEDEQLATLMRGLRGQNLRDSLFAEDDVELRLVEKPGIWLRNSRINLM
ncbi:hypothetical protein CR513_41663 [Mucuna pruriens]|uniref:Uncharacterized protein n=1 Tax=Mucuna pruriens TaxID=157652 RepID=A0A371FIM3_MUCPR|nr:hypothetical protein CR513_41663 [Mucuna pruriens]